MIRYEDRRKGTRRLGIHPRRPRKRGGRIGGYEKAKLGKKMQSWNYIMLESKTTSPSNQFNAVILPSTASSLYKDCHSIDVFRRRNEHLSSSWHTYGKSTERFRANDEVEQDKSLAILLNWDKWTYLMHCISLL